MDTYSANDVVKLEGVNFADLTFTFSGNDAIIGYKAATGYTGTLDVQNFVAMGNDYGNFANAHRLNKFVTDDKTFGLALGNGATPTLYGSSLDDYILSNFSAAGADSIDGGAGADTIYGGEGNDYIKYDTNDAVVNAGNGNDTLYMTAAGTLNLTTQTQFTNFEVLLGSSLADMIGGSSAAETLMGASGADSLWSAGGNDMMNGGVGADTYWFGVGDGLDTIAQDTVNSKSDVVFFQSTATAAFSDLSFALNSAGSDLLIGVGAGGTDTLTLAGWVSPNTAATANLYRVNTFVTSDATFGLAIANDVATSLAGTVSTMNYWIQGGNGDDTLKAGATLDRLYGKAGNDILQYSTTATIFDGGNDTDTLTAASKTAGVNIDLRTASMYKNIEYLQGSSLADKLSAMDVRSSASIVDTVEGGKGADSLYGALGYNDYLIGGAGADSYWFGALDGADTISDDGSNNKTDAVVFYSQTFSKLGFERVDGNANLKITVNGAEGYTDNIVLANWGAYMDDTTSAGTTRVNRVNTFITSDMTFGLAIGTSDNNVLIGSSIADYIVGGAGDDTISGGLGADAIYGNDGNDRITYTAAAVWIDGGNDTNTLTAATSTSAVSILLSDTSKIQNFTILEGSSLADKLGGSSLAETIQGGAGADSLWGAAGDDKLLGGAGADSYWFGVSDGADTIAADTTNNIDTVMFYGTGIGGGGIASTVLSGDNLTISLTSGGSLTLENWKLTDGSKVNSFYFEQNNTTYTLTVDSSNVATWTVKA